MSDDSNGSIVNNSAFWIAVIASFSALTITLVKICSKSLCSEVSCCCGLCRIKRNIEAETELREFEINHERPPADNARVANPNSNNEVN
jgi:hypothetical protein